MALYARALSLAGSEARLSQLIRERQAGAAFAEIAATDDDDECAEASLGACVAALCDWLLGLAASASSSGQLSTSRGSSPGRWAARARLKLPEPAPRSTTGPSGKGRPRQWRARRQATACCSRASRA